MLNKRTSDLLFIGMVLLVIGAIIGIRVLLVGQIDSRLESIEASNRNLTNSIRGVERLVENNRDQPLPSMIEMHQLVPLKFDRDQLLFYVYANLELAGVSVAQEVERSVTVPNTPTTFPQGSTFRTLSNNLNLYTVSVSFKTQDITQLDLFLETIMNGNQLFIVQNVEYDIIEETDWISVSLALIAVYYK